MLLLKGGAKMPTGDGDALLQELIAIKRLLVYSLLNKSKLEHSQDDIAVALGVSQSKVSRMMSGSAGKEPRGR
jgi:predicted transcriptional regulator